MSVGTRTTEMMDVIGAVDPARLGARVPSGNPVHFELLDFLIDEGRLLDHNRIDEWFALIAPDVVYRMPVRQTRNRLQGPGFDTTMAHFDEDYATLKIRVRRLSGDSAWAEDPPSRVRRFVSNVVVHETDVAEEYLVSSYLLALRSRWDATEFDQIPMQRDDLIRRTPDGWRIARRIMYIDQSVLGTPNLAIFL